MFVVNNFYEPDMFLFSKYILCTFLMVGIVLVLKFTERLLVPVYTPILVLFVLWLYLFKTQGTPCIVYCIM